MKAYCDRLLQINNRERVLPFGQEPSSLQCDTPRPIYAENNDDFNLFLVILFVVIQQQQQQQQCKGLCVVLRRNRSLPSPLEWQSGVSLG